jgi:hypothetical protein
LFACSALGDPTKGSSKTWTQGDYKKVCDRLELIAPDAPEKPAVMSAPTDRADLAHRPNISEDDLAAAFAAGSLHEKRKAKQLVRMAENGAQLKVPAIP